MSQYIAEVFSVGQVSSLQISIFKNLNRFFFFFNIHSPSSTSAPTDNSNSACTGQRSELKEKYLQLYKQMRTLTLFHSPTPLPTPRCVDTIVREGYSFTTCFFFVCVMDKRWVRGNVLNKGGVLPPPPPFLKFQYIYIATVCSTDQVPHIQKQARYFWQRKPERYCRYSLHESLVLFYTVTVQNISISTNYLHS